MAASHHPVPAGVRATLALLARIHADLDSAQTPTTACPTSTEHAPTPLGRSTGARNTPRRARPARLQEAS